MPTLNWLGKDKVVNYAAQVPCHALDFKYNFGGTSGNKIIHGDNLLALKSLLPLYAGRVKCIYIDPPYNTGNEGWIYNDNVNSPQIQKWLGQVVGREGEDLTRHDKWLCMMYPRLKLLKQLLSDDGAIFISIDDNEQANLKLVCDEIFGAQNFVAESIVQSNSAKNNANFISVTHEYLLIYAKDINSTPKNWRVKKSNADEFKKRCLRLIKSGFSAEEIHKELLTLTKYPRFFEFDHYTYSDEKGPFRASDLTAPNSKNFYDIIHPVTKLPCKVGGRGWAYSENEMNRLIAAGKIFFGKDETVMPQLKNYLFEDDTSLAKSVLFFDTQATTKWVKANRFEFNFPKPVELIEYILQMYPNKNSIVLDAFAGSGTTAHAVLNLNAADGGDRKFILIEMEPYAESITAERVRRVGGSFDYYEVGEPLFVEGDINPAVSLEQIRGYVWATETATEYVKPECDDCAEFLGVDKGTAYYFYTGVLDSDFLATMRTRADSYVIFAESNAVGEEFLQKYKIEFKKIPRDIVKIWSDAE
ncbi:MAG: site-specific DNA-methyltransferase [Selenomonadaceae bacterium]|nr:site-specific DNA-methyltransferase [Selenomonadaceae bacterium]